MNVKFPEYLKKTGETPGVGRVNEAKQVLPPSGKILQTSEAFGEGLGRVYVEVRSFFFFAGLPANL